MDFIMEHVLPRTVSEGARNNSLRSAFRPRNCVWELTLNCNLNCVHCGSSAGRARHDEMTTAECLDVVDQLAALDCDLITLSGGEPMMRPDWFVIARAIADRGIHVNMVTNGLLITDRSAALIAESGMCNVGVSIDGPEEVHDRIRAKGAFAKSMEGIRTLVRNGVSVGVMTTINKWNMSRLAEIRQIAIDAGASMWRLQLAKPMGEICGDTDFIISPRDLLHVIPALAAMKRQGGIHLAVGDSIGYYGPHDETLRGRGWRGRSECWQGCRAGMDAIGIEADGGIKGCLSIQAKAPDGSDPWREGSVREHSLAELWFRPGAFGFNREFTADQLKGVCRTCRKASTCHGGARCVSTAVAGIVGEDPYCWLRVSTMADNRRFREYAARAAAAAGLALIMGGAACLDDDDDKTDNGAEVTVLDAVGDEGAAVDVGPDAINCENVCCECDYGIIPEAVYKECCLVQTSDQVSDTVEPDVQPVDIVKSDAVDCENVCCMCDYGIIPQEIWEECCNVPPVEPTPDVVEPADVPGDVIDCDTVCCACEYGIIPENVWDECCVVQPADPAPDAVEPDVVADVVDKDAPVNCEAVCCLCDYGIIPEDVYQECCVDPCKDVCCDCDYGEPPPPQCCP